MEKVFFEKCRDLFIQYLFSIERNGEKMKEDKLRKSVFCIIKFLITNNIAKQAWTWYEVVYALLGGFR